MKYGVQISCHSYLLFLNHGEAISDDVTSVLVLSDSEASKKIMYESAQLTRVLSACLYSVKDLSTRYHYRTRFVFWCMQYCTPTYIKDIYKYIEDEMTHSLKTKQ